MHPLELKNKHITIFGLGRSGWAVAKALVERGAIVKATEVKTKEEVKEVIGCLDKLGIEVETGGHTPGAIEGADLIVVSPGVPLDIPILLEAKKRGIPIVGEIELAYQLWSPKKSKGLFGRPESLMPLIAVAGTNGKSITASLIAEILKKDGKQTIVAGNIAPGVTLIEAATKATPKHIIVAEVSSFQLESIDRFKPWIAVLLNISPDHLDRYKSFQEYVEAKSRLFLNQEKGDFAILNYDDEVVMGLASKTKAHLILFSRTKIPKTGAYLSKETIMVNWNGESHKVCELQEVNLKGSYDLENALAAICVAWICRVRLKNLIRGLKEFSGLEHRMESVGRVGGIEFINNSMCTNPTAAIKTLEAFDKPVILIAGGKDKGFDFTQLGKVITKKVKLLILLGESADRIEAASRQGNFQRIRKTKSLPEAVNLAYSEGCPGDIVLLSPACASFDMFRNFEERGRIFKEAVWDLKRKVSG